MAEKLSVKELETLKILLERIVAILDNSNATIEYANQIDSLLIWLDSEKLRNLIMVDVNSHLEKLKKELVYLYKRCEWDKADLLISSTVKAFDLDKEDFAKEIQERINISHKSQKY